MASHLAFLLVVGLVAVNAQRGQYNKLIVTPCAADNSLLTVKKAVVNPMPAVIPGDLDIEVSGSLNKDMPKLFIKASITKSFFGGTQRNTIPCISGYGSCVYDICELTKNLASCPDLMVKMGIPCQCPFTKFNIDNFSGTFKVPSLPPLLSWLTDGDYEARAEIMSSRDGPVRACYDVKASITDKAVDCNNALFKFGPLCKKSSAGSKPSGGVDCTNSLFKFGPLCNVGK